MLCYCSNSGFINETFFDIDSPNVAINLSEVSVVDEALKKLADREADNLSSSTVSKSQDKQIISQ